jgi:hypothetical protein
VIIERTEKSLKELAKTLAVLPEDDPQQVQVLSEMQEVNEERQKAFDEQAKLIKAAIATFKAKTARLKGGS